MLDKGHPNPNNEVFLRAGRQRTVDGQRFWEVTQDQILESFVSNVERRA